jgi:magnesium transporter
MDYLEIVNSLNRILATRDDAAFAVIEQSAHPADIAAAFAKLPSSCQSTLFRMASPQGRADIFGYLTTHHQLRIAEQLDRSQLVQLVLDMPADERADLYNDLPEASRDILMPALAQVEREDIRRLASYAETTVGAVMTSEYATLTPQLSAGEALEELRRIAPDRETIYQSYVIDPERRLLGTVSLRQLIVAPPQTLVGDIMTTDPVVVKADAPREDAVRLIARYDLLALPVTNGDDKLVGIVTYDDAMDVEQAETDTDFRKVGAVSELGSGLKEASITLLYRKRVFWLVLLVFGNVFSGAGIAYFEDTILAYVALVFFLPLLVDSGGNAGAQSATLMVRALATGDVVLRDWASMLLRELFVAGLLGATMALAVSGLGLWRGGPEIAIVVALSMQLIVLIGSLIGMSLPFLLSRMKLDPATASAPLITTIADATGVVIYFAIATTVLGLPT